LVSLLVNKNYSLTMVYLRKNKTGELGTLLRLKQVVRRYLIEDAACIAKGIEVLIGVVVCFNICWRTRRSVISSISITRRQRRVPISTNANVSNNPYETRSL
jgi:hypothetical protein